MNDFDFQIGTWNVANRTLNKRMDGSWDEFPSRVVASTHFDGKVSFEVGDFPTRGFGGIALRLFNPETELWSIYWIDSRTMRLDPPVIGRFEAGVGTFVGDDTIDDQPVKWRFVWSHITPTSARWQQELSKDDGATWEANWVMEFTRA